LLLKMAHGRSIRLLTGENPQVSGKRYDLFELRELFLEQIG
jgi:hypothetical protein